MKRRLFLLMLMLSWVCGVMAQQSEEDYYLYKIDRQSARVEEPKSDTLLFLRLGQHRNDMYGLLTDYHFSFVELARRGFAYYEREAMVDGIDVNRSDISILRRLLLDEQSYAGISSSSDALGWAAGSDEFSMTQSIPLRNANVGVFFSGRGYLYGARASSSWEWNNGWNTSVSLLARGGADMYVDGVYNNSIDAGVRFGKVFDSEAVLSFLILSRVGERGLRQGSIEEAFTLRSDYLYNPMWGRQGSEIRNARVRRDRMPFAMMVFSSDVSLSTQMTISVGGNYGYRSYSSLGWYSAMTPRPDNYRYLPSYFSSDKVAEAVAEQWREGNEKYTQIDWQEIYYQNQMANGQARYALEDRVSRIAKGQAMVKFDSRLSDKFSLTYALRATYNSTRNFKQMRDLLGALYLDDIDYYLVDDDTYSGNLQNNLLQPNRRIGVGDRFSYDYVLVDKSIMGNVVADYRFSRWVVNAAMMFGSRAMYRRGYYEKEIYPENGSYARSRVERESPYVFKALVGYSFSPYNYIDAGVILAARSSEVKNLFLNPEYNNRMIDNPSMENLLSAEINYKFSSYVVDMAVTAYLNSTQNGGFTMRAYDDLSSMYCDVVVSELDQIRYGIEASSTVNIINNLQASLALSWGRFFYSDNPMVSHYSDVDNSPISINAESHMESCRLGGAPGLCAMVSLNYITYRGWAASLGVQAAADRYVEPSFVRRTDRVARLAAASPEIYEAFMHQQRLNDALTVDASLSRWFNIGQSRLSFTLSVNNLLGKRDIIYGGYEQSRIRNYMSGSQRVYAPQQNIITYGYPRTWRGVVSWKF